MFPSGLLPVNWLIPVIIIAKPSSIGQSFESWLIYHQSNIMRSMAINEEAELQTIVK